MEKVKVTRYMRGQRPEFAPESSSDEEEDVEVGGFQGRRGRVAQVEEKEKTYDDVLIEDERAEIEKMDRRLRRLQQREKESESDGDDEEDDAYVEVFTFCLH